MLKNPYSLSIARCIYDYTFVWTPLKFQRPGNGLKILFYKKIKDDN